MSCGSLDHPATFACSSAFIPTFKFDFSKSPNGQLIVPASGFRSDGSLKPEAGTINWPFGDFEKSNLKVGIKAELQAKVAGWSNDPQDIIDNAFVYACMHNQIDAARSLLEKGAQV